MQVMRELTLHGVRVRDAPFHCVGGFYERHLKSLDKWRSWHDVEAETLANADTER